jgi:adenosylmethionine-8-amino-7-oxononanoate aminotransferase
MNLQRNSWEQREVQSFFHTFTDLPSLRQHGPTVIERGEGIYVFDVQGKRYIEGNSGLWNIVLGYDNAQLVEAAAEQYRRFPAYHTFFGRNSMPTVELAERLLSLAPVPMSRVFFTNSGSEANDSVVKLLWLMHAGAGEPARRKMISRKNAYHGTTVMTSSLTGKDYVKAFGLPLPGVVFADCPHHWRFADPGESEPAFAKRLAANLDALIRQEGPETIAGFIAEPVMGAGGVLPPPEGYFPAVQSVLRRYGIPLVADEVICGFGRTGNLWGCQTYGIEPDIIVASKVLTAGYFPMGAVILSEAIDRKLTAACERYEEFPHGFTTGGHPVGSAIALKSLEIITEGGVLENVRGLAPHFQAGLRALGDHPLVGEARGVGLMGALEIVAAKKAKQAFAGNLQAGERIATAARERGLIIRPIGSAVVIAPPFIITRAQIDELLRILRETLDEVWQQLKPHAAA